MKPLLRHRNALLPLIVAVIGCPTGPVAPPPSVARRVSRTPPPMISRVPWVNPATLMPLDVALPSDSGVCEIGSPARGSGTAVRLWRPSRDSAIALTTVTLDSAQDIITFEEMRGLVRSRGPSSTTVAQRDSAMAALRLAQRSTSIQEDFVKTVAIVRNSGGGRPDSVAVLSVFEVEKDPRFANPRMRSRDIVRRCMPARRLATRDFYLSHQVDEPVQQLPGTGRLRYPDVLRSAGTEGTVIAQFLVDTTGHYADGSFTVLRSDHALFSAAVLSALPAVRFVPATLDGRKVAQQVQQPFTFSLPQLH